jgi:hypothetical protein
MGTRTIETNVYDHNFFVIDRHPIGPGLVVKFPFNLKGEGVGFGELAEIQGNQISFLRTIGNGEEVKCFSLEGFGPDAADYEIRIEPELRLPVISHFLNWHSGPVQQLCAPNHT